MDSPRLIFPDGREFRPWVKPPTSNNIPGAVIVGRGFRFTQFMQILHRVVVVLHDKSMDDRSTTLSETNELHPLRPVVLNLVTVVAKFISANIFPKWQTFNNVVSNLDDYRVQPTGKIIFNWNGRNLPLYQFLYDLLLEKNTGRFFTRGDGFADTVDDDVPLVTEQYPNMRWPNPEKALKVMAAVTGGNVRLVTDQIIKAGNKYDIIETFHEGNLPEKRNDGRWYLNDEVISPETHPHMFTYRVNRRQTSKESYLSGGGVVATSDGGVTGGKGKERWPTAIDTPYAAIEHHKVLDYPQLPARLMVFKNSVIVDGNFVPANDGLEIWADEYHFAEKVCYVHDSITNQWYVADEMKVTADPEIRQYATGFDYACFTIRFKEDGTLEGKPWMGPLGYREPDCGWMRTKKGYILV